MDEGFTKVLPEEHQRAAEEVRAHLVAIRGGAPFLSSADARLLVGWLEQGVSVVSILAAIEFEAERRRKKPSKLPFTLTRVKMHLKGQNATREITLGVSGVFEPIARLLDAQNAGSLASDLRAITEDNVDSQVRAALTKVREFLVNAWEGLSNRDRQQRIGRARDLVSAMDLGYDEAELDLAAEELAREDLRREWPMLEAQALWDLARRGVR